MAYHSGDDEAWLDGEWGVRLVPARKTNITPHRRADGEALRHRRGVRAGVNSQFVARNVLQQRQQVYAHNLRRCRVGGLTVLAQSY